ncbi:MAG: DNA-3-methyladenine glycosylase 2 family protein, partial [Rhodoglobus sp.]
MTLAETADAAPLVTTYAPALPVNPAAILRPLVRGHFDPTLRTDASGIWRTARTPHGAATMHVSRRQGNVEVAAWGSG